MQKFDQLIQRFDQFRCKIINLSKNVNPIFLALTLTVGVIFFVTFYFVNENNLANDLVVVQSVKSRLESHTTITPLEDSDTNLIKLAQNIVNEPSKDVDISIEECSCSQIAKDGTISYGDTEAIATVTFKIKKNRMITFSRKYIRIPVRKPKPVTQTPVTTTPTTPTPTPTPKPTPVSTPTPTPTPIPTPTPVPTPTPSPVVSFNDNFESNFSSMWMKELPNNTYSATISKNHAVNSVASLRVELRKTDPNVYGSKRSELALMNNEVPLEYHKYNLSIFLPKGGSEDYAFDPVGSEIITQWHNVPDANEQWTVPPLALRTFKGRYVLERYWDDAKITTTEQMEAKKYHATYDLGSYESDKGSFVNWSFKIKWGWLASQNPRLEIFKNGTKILDVAGSNTTNDQKGNIWKIGLYKWDWAQGANNTSILSTRVIYYDNASIEEVK